MNSITQARQDILQVGKSLFDRGLTCGSSANISVRVEEGFLITPTNSCIGFLHADQLSLLSHDGTLISGEKASKEFILHQAFYDNNPSANAVIHLHSSWSTAVSCLQDINDDDAVTALTPYLIMRLGAIGAVPYFPPGDQKLAAAISSKAQKHAGILMANHGPIVCGKDLWSTMYAIEELEESCKLMLLMMDKPTRQLSSQDCDLLSQRFAGKF